MTESGPVGLCGELTRLLDVDAWSRRVGLTEDGGGGEKERGDNNAVVAKRTHLRASLTNAVLLLICLARNYKSVRSYQSISRTVHIRNGAERLRPTTLAVAPFRRGAILIIVPAARPGIHRLGTD